MNTIDTSSSLQHSLAGLTAQTRPVAVRADQGAPGADADTLSLSAAAEAVRAQNESAALQTPDEALLATQAASRFMTSQPANAALSQGSPDPSRAAVLVDLS